jgi:hypothetical protein
MWRSKLDARLAKLERQSPEYTWLHQEGLHALLEAAKLHRPDPWDLPDVMDEEQTPFTDLLREAREWHAQEAKRSGA